MHVRFLTAALILGCIVLFFPQAAAAKAWRGIVPLHSTRGDVERLLGPPNLEDSGYEIDGARVQISYTARGCQEGLPSGWSVPADTVVSISVSAGDELLLNDVLVSGRTYDQIYAVHTPQLIQYVDAEEGVRYSSIEGYVLTTTYFGTAADDKKLRCGESKYAAPVPAGAKNRFEQVPFDSYGRIPFADAKDRLDNFGVQLQSLNESKSNYRGFIIVYAGRSAHAGDAANTAECSKTYLVTRRKFDPEIVIAADGGYRDDFTVELYIMPNDSYPPMLTPTVSPRKVEILPGS
ncbi:MAG: hypothetical protein QOK48_1403, partial [Blastocatellia bacterium]|nr:hypothetical protein [Blastocatellia bacterium]